MGSMGDKVSAFLGAPPNYWTKNEVEQVKQIHRCYRRTLAEERDDDNDVDVAEKEHVGFSLEVGNKQVLRKKAPAKAKDEEKEDELAKEEADRAEYEQKKDEEEYLPQDSPLRSREGDKKAPLNPTFKDYDTFMNTCNFEYWNERFNLTGTDTLLSATAATLVRQICEAQGQGRLRVSKGYVPLRKKREQITPLTLVLHEIKLWAAHELRTMSVFDANTYKVLRRRIRYLDMLSHKEVWGPTAILIGSGMKALAHDQLFRLLLGFKESLERAEEYSYRGFCGQSSREKFMKAEQDLKAVLIKAMQTVSCSVVLDKKIADIKSSSVLEPLMLLNTMQNQNGIDYSNFTNVLLYKLAQNPLVKGALVSNYEGAEVEDEVANLDGWRENNFFCVAPKVAASGEPQDEPYYVMDSKNPHLPAIYEETAKQLRDEIRRGASGAIPPRTGKEHLAAMSKAFEGPENAEMVIKALLRVVGAIQDLIPPLYAVHEIFKIAADGGNLTVYDTLRHQVMNVMVTTATRVKMIQDATKDLQKLMGNLSFVKEKAMEIERLKKKKGKFMPKWVVNYKYIQKPFVEVLKKKVRDTQEKLHDIGNDAYNYSLTSEELNEKVRVVKKIIFAVTGYEDASANEVVRPKDIAKPPTPVMPSQADKLMKSLKEEEQTRKLMSGEPTGEKDKDVAELEFQENAWDKEFGANNMFKDNDDKSDGGHEQVEKFNPFAGATDDDSDSY